MKVLLPKLAKRLYEFRRKAIQLKVPEFKNKVVIDADGPITHEWLWWRVGGWLKEKDLIITEAGTLWNWLFCFIIKFASAIGSVSYGIIDLQLPKDSALLAQKLWASIGWSPGQLAIFIKIKYSFRRTEF